MAMAATVEKKPKSTSKTRAAAKPPEDSLEDQQAAESRITPADVILPNEYYSYEMLSELIAGIGCDQYNSHPWREYKMHAGNRPAFRGSRVIEWLDNCVTGWRLTEQAEKTYDIYVRAGRFPDKRVTETPVQPSKPKPPANIVEAARRVKEERQTKEEADRERELEALRAEHLEILIRDVQGKAKSGDATRLLAIADELDLPIEVIEVDAAFVRKAMKLQDRAADRDAKNERHKKAMDACRQFEREIEDAKVAVFKERDDAYRDVQMAANATTDLNQMRNERPELFEAGNLPQLKAHA